MTRTVWQGWQAWDEAKQRHQDKPMFVCADEDRDECQRQLDEFAERQRARGYGADRYYVEEKEVTTDFVIPDKGFRSLYTVNVQAKQSGNPERHWGTNHVEILLKGEVIAEYDRNYPSTFHTFEPFRQGDRHYALIAPHYTATSVMDLHTGEIVASEKPAGNGFCPVGFYVPDWWDVHDDSIPAGSHFLVESNERPDGSFGFVWGCHWGDDSSWKVQYLDLSKVSEGVIARDNRFGYVELAAIGNNPSEFIRYEPEGGYVTFAVEKTYKIGDGSEIR